MKCKIDMIRSILSVIAGYATMVVLVMLATVLAVKTMLPATDLQSAMKLKPTPSYLAVNLAYSGLFAVLGGFVTAAVAGRAPLPHALALAVMMIVLGIVSLLQSTSGQQPRWYGLTLLLLLCCLMLLLLLHPLALL